MNIRIIMHIIVIENNLLIFNGVVIYILILLKYCIINR